MNYIGQLTLPVATAVVKQEKSVKHEKSAEEQTGMAEAEVGARTAAEEEGRE